MTDRHLVALLLCPTGQDSTLIAEVLKREDIDSVAFRSIPELCTSYRENAGVIILAEEALTVESIDILNKHLSDQEPWSDIPLILLTSGGRQNHQFKLQRLEVFVASGNVTLLERPLQPLTLLSATKVAMRARRRQYLVKKLMASQLEATNVRDEFMSIASHELKTPLTSLKLQTQMSKKQLSKNGYTPERIEKQLDYTINQIDRLNKLVDDMLDVSRINTGKLQIHKSNFNLSDLLHELIERFRPQFEGAGCKIETDIAPNIVVNWDAYKIEQVINNLFSNAIRYSSQKKVHVGLTTENGVAIINVKDEGAGIDPANLERIFERFERATSTSSGLGLGLYISRQIVELHKGTIHVESKLGKGSNFIIKIPVSNLSVRDK